MSARKKGSAREVSRLRVYNLVDSKLPQAASKALDRGLSRSGLAVLEVNAGSRTISRSTYLLGSWTFQI